MYYLQIKVKNTYSRLSCSQASPKPRPDRKHLRRRISVPSVLTISTLCRLIPTKGKKKIFNIVARDTFLPIFASVEPLRSQAESRAECAELEQVIH